MTQAGKSRIGRAGVVALALATLLTGPAPADAEEAPRRWWAHAEITTDSGMITDVAADRSGNTYLAGFVGGWSGGVAKLDASGRVLWSRHGLRSGVSTVAAGPDGHTFVAGAFHGPAEYGGVRLGDEGCCWLFVARLDPDGEVMWARPVGVDLGQVTGGERVLVDEGGDVVVAAWLEPLPPVPAPSAHLVAKLSANGEVLWSRACCHRPLRGWWPVPTAVTPDRAVLVESRTQVPVGAPVFPIGFQNVVTVLSLEQFGADGTPGLPRPYGEVAGLVDDTAMAADGAGNLYVTGGFVGSATFGSTSLTSPGWSAFLVKIAPGGAVAWARQLGGDEPLEGGVRSTGVAVDSLGNAVLAGTRSRGQRATALLAAFDPTGDLLWQRELAASRWAAGERVALAADDDVVLTGRFDGELVLGSARLTGDTFAVKLPQPRPRSTAAACPPGQVPAGAFTDTEQNVHAAAIDCAAWRGLAAGGPGGRPADVYGPELTVSRAQVASLLARLIDVAAPGALPGWDGRNRFADVADTSPHVAAVNRLAEAGVVAGGPDGLPADRFAPSHPVRRGQLASLLDRTRGLVVGLRPRRPDDFFYDDDASPHEAAIDALARRGVVTGRTLGEFEPAGAVRRDAAASFLVRLLDDLLEERGSR